MRTNLLTIAILLLLTAGQCGPLLAADDSGTFRGKWWNYYDRALNSADHDDLAGATRDLRRAQQLRERDQRMARTYGMHFIDYFPHRELGVVLYRQGDLAGARAELELSLSQAESAKAAYYLNRVRRDQFRQEGRRFAPPGIVIDEPAAGAALAGLTVKVKGRVTSPGLVAAVTIGRTPLAVELARDQVAFEQDVVLGEGDEELTVTGEDLLGTTASQSVAFTVDRDGPAVSLAQVRLTGGEGDATVRLTGQVEDRTGIRSVTVAGRTFDVGGTRSYPLDLTVPRRGGSPIELRAVDLLGNETVAMCDPEQELAAFAPRRVLLAAAGPLALFDREPPTIVLREAADLPAVFVDRYSVEGEAADNSGIDRVLVGGHEVAFARGRKVFFNKLVKLREGENRILVEVFDRAGNRSQATVTVRRVVPAARQVGARMSVTLLPFDGRAVTKDLGQLAGDLLLGAFVEQKRFAVVERDKLQQVLREQQLTAARLTDPDQSVRVGRLVAADAVLATSIREDARSLEVVTRVINTETAEVMAVKDMYSEDRSAPVVRQQMEGLAAKVAGSFPLAEGMVIGREQRELVTDLGSSAQVRKSTGAIVYRLGKELKHPVTGRSLGRDMVKLGEGRFEDVRPEFSRLRLSDRAPGQEIVVRDLLITR